MAGSIALISIGLGIFILLGVLVALAKIYRKVDQGKALIINPVTGEPKVTFTGALAVPIFNKIEIMDISVKTIEIDRRGKEGLICRDNIRADIKVTFFVRVNKTREDVIKVAQAIGCVRASDPKTLEELFNAKFSEALKTVGKQLDFVDLYTKRDEFRDQIVQVIGRDLNGYVLEDAAIDFLEQTPITALDPNNILDAQGIRKITELTAIEKVRTNEYSNNERKLIKKQDVEAAETIMELERQQADALSKQQREIDTMRAREQAETAKVAAEERLKAELARIKADEEIAIQEQNQQRQVEVAQKNRERVIAVETERVEKERALEAIVREREVELQRIAKEKDLEEQRKLIADVVRQRIVVDKTVAEEEERIKDLRVLEEARRIKQATVIAAEAEAEEKLVKDIKAAEAAEQSAKHRAAEQITLAEASLEAADRQAKAKMRLAEGLQAEAAAQGLAEVKVKEADAAATERHGLAEAVVLRERGLAEASAVGERLAAEASGIAAKAGAMKALDEAGRGHEEFRLRLENERAIELESIKARREVAEAHAHALGEAFKSARIDIIGGESMVVDRILNAVSMGKAVDGFVDRSQSARTLLRDYLEGDASLTEDLKEILSRPSLSAQDVQSLTLAAVLGRLMTRSNGDQENGLNKLLDKARELGLDEVQV
ncbi:MAG TPA: flotillin family protein [Thermoanaerobaculia bacterium]|nr:flotillin family protein [Thermoanaerobaculia bacterium]